jgi:hypothetical protein
VGRASSPAIIDAATGDRLVWAVHQRVFMATWLELKAAYLGRRSPWARQANPGTHDRGLRSAVTFS